MAKLLIIGLGGFAGAIFADNHGQVCKAQVFLSKTADIFQFQILDFHVSGSSPVSLG